MLFFFFFQAEDGIRDDLVTGLQTCALPISYFYQNHPIILDLYRRHHAREINFVGTVATIAGSDNFDRDRHCRAAANLVKWNLRADGAVLSKYGGGFPPPPLAGTAPLLCDLRKPTPGAE